MSELVIERDPLLLPGGVVFDRGVIIYGAQAKRRSAT